MFHALPGDGRRRTVGGGRSTGTATRDLRPLGIERMFPFMDRSSELESIRRSIAMLNPRAAASDREEAMALLAELQEVQRRLGALRSGLRSLLKEEADR